MYANNYSSGLSCIHVTVLTTYLQKAKLNFLSMKKINIFINEPFSNFISVNIFK